MLSYWVRLVISMRASTAAGAFAALGSVSVMAQGSIASDQPMSGGDTPMAPTMLQLVPYPYEPFGTPDGASAAPYASCFRVGRCSTFDLYRFRDRPNRLTRLAPEPPPDVLAGAAWIPYRWLLVPVTPEENIRPQHRARSQVRDEFRDVGRPIDEPN